MGLYQVQGWDCQNLVPNSARPADSKHDLRGSGSTSVPRALVASPARMGATTKATLFRL